MKIWAPILCTLSLLFGFTPQPPDPLRPNIVLIFMDDMGYGDPECYGGYPYHTPHINQLAAEGMRFTNFYAAQAVCSASRAALLTGCYPNRLSISGAFMPWSTVALNPEEETLAELLKARGYATGMAGKWHLGQKEPFLPLQNGFDEYLGLPYSNDMWPVDFAGQPITDTALWKAKYPALPLIEGNKTQREIKTLEDQSTLTTLYTERATGFIQRHAKEPFFLYLAHSMPHVPIAASSKFKGKSGAGLFGDVMEELDWSVGQVMDALEKNGLTDHTLFIFTSDNGPWLTFGNHAGSSGGLREGKGTAWDGGLKVPCIMRWPEVIPQGTICNKLVSTLDVLPTVVGITGAKMPVLKIDGVDIRAVLENKPDANPRDEFAYYYDRNNLKAVRKGPYKLVFPGISQTYKKNVMGLDGFPGKWGQDTIPMALYDLRNDPGETLDVQAQHPEIVEQLKAVADTYRAELGDDLTDKKGIGVRAAGKVVFEKK